MLISGSIVLSKMKERTVMILILTMVILMTVNVQAGPSASLPPCPAKPNCVSSQAADSHRIEPFTFSGDARLAFEKLRNLLALRSDTKLVSSDDTTIRVEFRTALGFIDDGLFLLDTATGTINIRSAARLGYWDLGKNRSRMEEIRRAFAAVQSGHDRPLP
jgi:uncharacterized protein (DUF1499 family)